MSQFNWDDAIFETEYELRISTDGSSQVNFDAAVIFTDLAIAANTTSANYNELTANEGPGDAYPFPLANNTTYYWQIIAKDGTNDFKSAIWAFNTTADVSINAGNPLDGAFVYLYDPLLFNWYLGQAQGSLRFSLQVYEKASAPTELEWGTAVDNDINAVPNPLVSIYDNLITTSRTVNGLKGGTRYYWRVVAYYDTGSLSGSYDYDDRVAKYSSVYYFDTKGGAVEAYPSWPTGGALVYTLQPYFYYYTLEYEPSATFEVIVSTSATTGVNGDLTPAFTYSAGSNLFVKATSDLTAGTIYYWQVKTTYGSDVTYSTVSSFETDAIAGVVAYVPTPSYPTGGAVVYTTSPYLYWWVGGVSTDLLFEIEINTTNTFSGTATHTGISGLYYQTSGLTAGVTYYWKVRSYENGNASNASAWSSTGEFTVAGGGTSYTVASYPVSNPTVYSATPTLSWYVEGSTLGWTGYIVKWQADTAPADWAAVTGTVASINNINQTTYTFGTALTYGKTYYWAVALNNGGSPTHSDYAQGSFTVVGGSSVTVIPSVPSDGSVEYNRDVTFYWYLGGSSLGIQGYELQYSQTSNFSLVTTVPSGTVGTNMFYTVTGLTPGATYYWRVRGDYGSGNYTSYSTIYSFTVDAGASAVVPRIGSPARGVTVETGSPVLSWFNPVQSSSSLSYDVELSRNAEFTESVVYTDVNQLQAEASNLESGEYFWRVRSKTNEEISGYSESGNFKVKDGITSVAEESEVLPTVYELSQNYPNPFNPETTIKFSLAESQYVSIKIYNMLGQEVRTLMNEQRNQGSYNVLWNGKDNNGNQVSSGTYIYRIRAGEFVSTKKMVLLK